MRYFILTLFFIFFVPSLQAQKPGDTIRIKAMDYSSIARDTLVEFPDNDDLTFEKILLKYSMRCKDGLVSTPANRNLGCGEWDYSCNTYLVDSSKIETVPSFVASHAITNYTESIFPYKSTPVYNYLRGIQSDVGVVSTNNEVQGIIGAGTDEVDRTLSTANIAGKSQYIYTATELTAAGLAAGEIDGVALNVLSGAGEARYMRIKIKHTSQDVMSGVVEQDDFTEVYYKNTIFQAENLNRFQFHNPFIWDGTSNILVEFSFTNIDGDALSSTIVEGEVMTTDMGISSTNEQEIILTNNGYVQCTDFKGISGSQNRTIEAWIKTTDGSNGEIASWGINVTGKKWVFRLTNGRLRLEVHGGGTESSSAVDDGEWHHVACVLNGNNLGGIEFYIDGVLDVNQTVGTTAIDTDTEISTNVRISRGVNNRYLDAIVDDVRIWDTNLNEETIDRWKNLKIDETHPNYSSLQLNYEFSESGNEIIDNSVNGRNAALIGKEYKVGHLNGSTLFKDFILTKHRPNMSFFQGDYDTEITTVEVDQPIEKELHHFVVTRTIEQTNPDVAMDDLILDSSPVQYWTLDEKIYDELTGELIAENTLDADGEIVITDLEYDRRFPFYNELVSFVTPYGIGLDFGLDGKSWYMDMSDYVSILKGDRRLVMTLGGQRQEEMDLEFLFIVGTPPRDVIQYDQLWQGTNRIGSARISQILDDTKLAPVTVDLNVDGSEFILKSSITGHGAEGEFHQNGGTIFHKIFVDQEEIYTWDVTQECSENPIYPQGGTWVYDRQGWCPGEESLLTANELTSLWTPGSSMEIDYSTSNPSNPGGDYRYHLAHQLVGYSDANFQLDAALVGVMAPNNTAEFTRIGNVCANPTVVIRNTGATDLTKLTIKYWMNDSQSPQVYEWTGDLEFMEEEVVEIPSTAELWYDIIGENNIFHAEVSSPNDGEDQYSFNNSYRSTFDIPAVFPSEMSVEVKTNNFSNENSYQLLDSDGNIVGSNSLPLANTTFTDDYSLTVDGCYKLVIVDSGGDGLQWWANPTQGSGFARIRNGSGEVIETFESDFGGRFEYSFNTNFVISAEEIEFLTSIKVYPNPTSDYVNLEADDISEATFYVTDMMGKAIPLSIILQSDKAVSFDVANLNAGVYLIVVQKGDVLTTRKLIKE